MLVCRDSCGLGGLIVVLDCLGLVLVGKRQGLWMVLGWWTSSGGGVWGLGMLLVRVTMGSAGNAEGSFEL